MSRYAEKLTGGFAREQNIAKSDGPESSER